jgi:hypothetical protein
LDLFKMNLAEITEEIAALERRLELLRAAQTALQALATAPSEATKARMAERATGISAAIRDLITDKGPMTKADIDKALSDRYSLGKGSVSGALQAMKVRGIVVRTRAGKWTVKKVS